jgi:hypothetical protein
LQFAEKLPEEGFVTGHDFQFAEKLSEEGFVTGHDFQSCR